MADETAKFDENGRATLIAITDEVVAQIKLLLIDPVTGRLKVQATISGNPVLGNVSIEDWIDLPDWKDAFDYKIGNVVVANNGVSNNIYQSTSDHTSLATFALDSADWELISTGSGGSLTISTAQFNRILSALDNTPQKAFDTLDNKAAGIDIANTFSQAQEFTSGIEDGNTTTPINIAESGEGEFDTTKKSITGAVNELKANKIETSTLDTDGTLAANSDLKIATQKAIKTYTDARVGNAIHYIGGYDASGNTYPASGGSGTAGAIKKGDLWVISVAGTLGGIAVQVGDFVVANADTPGQTSSNWDTLNTNISYVPEDVANKKTTMTGNETSNVFYLTAKAIYDWATGLFLAITNKAAGSDIDTGTDDAKYTTAKSIVDSKIGKQNTRKSATFTDNDTSQTFTDADVTTTSIIDVYAQATPAGGWTVVSGTGDFTITSTVAESTDIPFIYYVKNN